MAKHSITVELDDDTLRCLAVLGKPNDVLVRLAHSAADGVRRPDRERREQTDKSLRIERDKTDAAIVRERETVEDAADEVVLLARQRADEVLETARHDSEPSERERTTADAVLQNERSHADAALVNERAERRRYPDASLANERDATNADLTGERAHADTLIVDQREANERMVSATIRAHELTVEADAAQARAEKTERELRQVAEFREMFIGVLGHDLRNPLTSIVMAARLLLRRGRLSEEDATRAARIVRSGQRMTRMISQILDLTRTRLGGGLLIERKPTDLRTICRHIVEEFEATIELDVEADVTGEWDEDRLAEVLSNLAGNAIDYATPGTAVIVRARAEGAAAVVEVINYGVPIPEDVLPFIFEPFRRAHQRERSASGNLGLGLYIAHEIVLAHGGTLEAHCADGTTTFVMRIPTGGEKRVDV